MMNQAAATALAIDLADKGEIPSDQRNVEVVRMMGVRLIHQRIPREVRRELSEAVKSGRLGHLKRDGMKPEAFFHPNGRANALEARDRAEREEIESTKAALKSVMAPPEH